MDTKPHGQPADSYEQRIDLALRSAASDPTAEPRLNPQEQNPKHAKNPSVGDKEAMQARTQEVNEMQSSRSSNMEEISMKGEQPHVEGQRSTQAIARLSPEIIAKRNELFDNLKRKQHAEILAKEKPEINVVLDLGLDSHGNLRSEMPVAAKAWESTPGSFLRHVDKDISSDVVIAKVDGKQLWDLDRPLEYACRVSYVPFSSPEGRNVFWHSSAHVLGEAAECQFNCLLSHGPTVEQGFFYDMAIADG